MCTLLIVLNCLFCINQPDLLIGQIEEQTNENKLNVEKEENGEEEHLSKIAQKIMTQMQNDWENEGDFDKKQSDFLKLQHVVDELVSVQSF